MATEMITQPMASHTLTGAQFSTYKIGGPLDEAYLPQSFNEAVACLEAIYPRIANEKVPFTVLGWGSNTLIASQGIRGITFITRKMTGIEQLDRERFRFEAGVHFVKVAKTAEEHALSGGEYMIGIPATVGGAVRMNAGATGQETSTVVESAECFNLKTGKLETLTQEELGFHYRHSAIDPTERVVLAATFKFTPGDAAAITQQIEANMTFRKTHQPTEPNAGSVFKNPKPFDLTVGQMIDQLGGKSWIEGGVRISPIHANFIINPEGKGSSLDVLRLMKRMKQTVFETHQVSISPENLFIGDRLPEEEVLWSYLQQDLR